MDLLMLAFSLLCLYISSLARVIWLLILSSSIFSNSFVARSYSPLTWHSATSSSLRLLCSTSCWDSALASFSCWALIWASLFKWSSWILSSKQFLAVSSSLSRLLILESYWVKNKKVRSFWGKFHTYLWLYGPILACVNTFRDWTWDPRLRLGGQQSSSFSDQDRQLSLQERCWISFYLMLLQGSFSKNRNWNYYKQ